MTLVDIEMYFKDRSSNHLGKLQDQIKKTQTLNDMAFENHILEIGEWSSSSYIYKHSFSDALNY